MSSIKRIIDVYKNEYYIHVYKSFRILLYHTCPERYVSFIIIIVVKEHDHTIIIGHPCVFKHCIYWVICRYIYKFLIISRYSDKHECIE